MRIAIFANTPAQIHFYRNIIKKIREHGHEVKLLVRDYGETLAIIESIESDYSVYSKSPTSIIGKIAILPYELIRAYKILYKCKPDIVTGFGIYDAFTSALLKTKCVVFEDSEPELTNFPYSVPYRACLPFVNTIITPDLFSIDLGAKHIKVNSYKELAYLHPNYFSPDSSILDLLGLEKGDDYVLLRFNAFDAVHDLGVGGFSSVDKIKLVRELEKYARVFISSEMGVPDEIKDRVMKIPKSRIHDAIFYAKLLVADTGTMVTEAACLGTPAVMLHPNVNKFGNFTELNEKYGLVFNYRGPDGAINKAVELIQRSDIKEEWATKREKLLKDKIDITAFMVWFIENWPESSKSIKKNPNFRETFR